MEWLTVIVGGVLVLGGVLVGAAVASYNNTKNKE